jgi:hypothetical protein
MKRAFFFALVIASVVSLLGLPASADGERELGSDAVLLTGNDLAVALTGVTAEGWSFDGENWFYFQEYYAPDGSIVGNGGPDEGSDAWNWEGSWRAEAEQACYVYPALDKEACRQIYVENGVYKNVTDGNVRAYWQPMP